MAQSASDVRAGGAYYELGGRDALTPVLAKLQARVASFGQFVNTFSPGSGGAGFFNRLVFGARDVDAKTGAYLGRVGGLVAPLRALFSPGAGGEGLVNRLLFGEKQTDASGRFLGRAGGLIGPLRALFSSGGQGAGLVNRWLFGKKLDIMGAYVGRVGGLKGLLGGLFDSGAGGSGVINNWLFGEKKLDANGQFVGRVGGLLDLTRSAGGGAARTLTAAASAARRLGTELIRVGAGLTSLGGIVAAPLAALFKGGVGRGANLANLSRELGVSVEALNKLQYAAERANVPLSEVMNDWTGRYSDLIAQAPPIDPRDAQAAAAAQRDLADASRSLQDALLPLVSALRPYLKELADWTKAHAHLIAPLLPIAAAVTALGLAFGAGGLAIGGWATAIAAGGPPLLALAAAVLPVLAVVGALTAVVGGVGYAFVKWTDAGKNLAATIRTDLAGALDTASNAWAGMAAALKKGDLQGAWDVAAAGMVLAWAGAMLRMQGLWVAFKSVISEGWYGLVLTLKLITNDFGSAVQKAFIRITGGIENAFRLLVAKVIDELLKVARSLNNFKPSDALTAAIKEAQDIQIGLGKKRDVEKEIEAVEFLRFVTEKDERDKAAKAGQERERSRVDELAPAQKAVTDAEATLKFAIEQANAPRAAAGPEKLPPLSPKLVPDITVKGGFSGTALGQQFGYGDKVQQLNELMKLLLAGPPGLVGGIGAAVGAAVRGAVVAPRVGNQ